MNQQQGHNSKEQLRSIIERVERINEEIASQRSDVKDVFAEAKGNGYDVKALRTIIRMRQQDANERAEQDALVDTYLNALNMV